MMKKTFFAAIIVLILMVACVSAYKMSDNNTVNTSLVTFYDSFDRVDTTPYEVGVSDIAGSPWNLSSVSGIPTPGFEDAEIKDNTLYFNFTSNSQIPVWLFNVMDLPTTGSYVVEYDLQNTVPSVTGLNNALEMYSYDPDTGTWFYGTWFYLRGSNDTQCVNGADNPVGNMTGWKDGTWHHFKVVVDQDNLIWTAYYDNVMMCNNISYTVLNATPGSINNNGELNSPIGNRALAFQMIGSSDGSQEVYQFDDMVVYTGSSPFVANTCTPDWICSSFDTCTANVTSCLNVTDNNICGEVFNGTLSTYDGICCSPDWFCTGYASCLPNNTSECDTVDDANVCGDTYTGNFSEFIPQACVYCVTDWVCDGYAACLNSSEACNSAFDNNACGYTYLGNYSEFTPQACSTPPITGYVGQYNPLDFGKIVIDFFGEGMIVVVGFISVVVIFLIMGYLTKEMVKVLGKGGK